MLKVSDVNKTYTNGVRALKNIELTIPCGIFGLLGPNGAGKSSLMRTLATLQLPDSGSITINGVDVVKTPDLARKRIGYLPQDFGLYPNISAESLLNQFALYKGITNKLERQDMVQSHLNMVNLEQHAQKYLGGFSGGMRQRFGIAQALLGSPDLLIVDEPTAGLDPAERIRLQNLLAELSENRVVLLSTHLVEDVLALCERIAVMNQGEIVCQGVPEELMAQMEGTVWTRVVNSAADIQAEWKTISSRVVRGDRWVRVLSNTLPEQNFESASVELDDVYFVALRDDCRISLNAN